MVRTGSPVELQVTGFQKAPAPPGYVSPPPPPPPASSFPTRTVAIVGGALGGGLLLLLTAAVLTHLLAGSGAATPVRELSATLLQHASAATVLIAFTCTVSCQPVSTARSSKTMPSSQYFSFLLSLGDRPWPCSHLRGANAFLSHPIPPPPALCHNIASTAE